MGRVKKSRTETAIAFRNAEFVGPLLTELLLKDEGLGRGKEPGESGGTRGEKGGSVRRGDHLMPVRSRSALQRTHAAWRARGPGWTTEAG